MSYIHIYIYIYVCVIYMSYMCHICVYTAGDFCVTVCTFFKERCPGA